MLAFSTRFLHQCGLAAVCTLLLPTHAAAQSLYGQVTDTNEQPVPGATVVWTGTSIGTRTDANGEYALLLPADTTGKPLRLAVIFQHVRDTFSIDDVTSYWTLPVSATVTIGEVTVLDENTGAYISVLQPVKVEIINRAELRKAACCDLAGCFETQSTVQPTTTNVLTNARELRILGLSGVYNQLLFDGLPTVQGLTYTYGLGTVPGSMIENIWVVKGANSVLQGYEGLVGQITVFAREGGTAEPLTADVLVNSFAEKHVNAAWAAKKGRSTNYLALHASLPGNRRDRDADNFLDLPLITRYSFYEKWRFRQENQRGFSAFVGLRGTYEERTGGQTDFRPSDDAGTVRAYGQSVRFRQPELLAKTGWRFDANTKVSLYTSFVAHNQASWFGLTRYDAGQRHGYANAQFERFWGPGSAHELKTGVSFRHLLVDETVGFAPVDTLGRTFAGDYRREENVAGVFAENTWNPAGGRWIVITGVRVDRHNAFGTRLTPRALVRYSPSASLDLRASAGTGWRTVNLFAENLALLTGNRDIVFAEALRPERAWNAGVNATRRFGIGRTQFTATADIYHTRFRNQFFPDYDTDPTRAIIANFTGKSVSNGVQAELSAAWSRQLELRAAYNFLDVYRVQNGARYVLPFNPRHRVLGVVTVRSPGERWQFDANVHWYGRQRLPDTRRNAPEWQRPAESSPYALLGTQLTRSWRRFELFAGAENLFDFRQQRPILGWQQPFARGFDPAFAWGPTRGRELYAGVRFRQLPGAAPIGD